MNLIQMVPGLFPRVDGIGDYALQLARKLRDEHGINTVFLVGDPEWSGGKVEGFYATKVEQRTPQEFFAAINRCESVCQSASIPLLVQFSPYGYQKRGYPLWLERALKQFAKKKPGSLNIAYHELEVHCRRPWSSAFWVSPLQKNLIAQVARLGNFQYTNTEVYRHKLERWRSGRMTLIPNFSTIAEPKVNPPFSQRLQDLIVFGRPTQRQWTYRWGSATLATACKLIGAKRIVDIGPPIEGDEALAIGGIPIVRCGRLEAEEVSRWMGSSLATFTYYPVPLLTKSSVHAVSCAHGTIPFVFDDQTKELSCPGLVDGEDYIALKNGEPLKTLSSIEGLSEKVFNNYQMRGSSVAAKIISQHMVRHL